MNEDSLLIPKEKDFSETQANASGIVNQTEKRFASHLLQLQTVTIFVSNK